MVSGLHGWSYEEKLSELDLCTLAERRHQLDMVQTYKIITEKDKVKAATWFKKANEGGRDTRAATDPHNVRFPAARLEIRRAFFSQRVPAAWNAVPPHIKAAKTATAFKNAYRCHRREQMAAAR